MFEIIQYTSSYREQWNEFVRNSKNGTFLLNRDYMDYHSNRFIDNSMMIFRKGKLYAILPANIKGTELHSHQGLTYGGLLMSDKNSTMDTLEIFNLINQKIKELGVKVVIYKPVPHIYHSLAAEEDLYALFKLNAKLVVRNISSTIFQDNKLKFIESRKSGVRKALLNNVIVEESLNYTAFWDVLCANLSAKHNIKPVHNLSDIELLHSRFLDQIKLFVAKKDNVVIGGTVVYELGQVIHTQYIAATEEGKHIGALDLLFHILINEIYINIPIFDFGHSTEEAGHVLNERLIFQKEGFGGRGICYDTYRYEI